MTKQQMRHERIYRELSDLQHGQTAKVGGVYAVAEVEQGFTWIRFDGERMPLFKASEAIAAKGGAA